MGRRMWAGTCGQAAAAAAPHLQHAFAVQVVIDAGLQLGGDGLRECLELRGVVLVHHTRHDQVLRVGQGRQAGWGPGPWCAQTVSLFFPATREMTEDSSRQCAVPCEQPAGPGGPHLQHRNLQEGACRGGSGQSWHKCLLCFAQGFQSKARRPQGTQARGQDRSRLLVVSPLAIATVASALM